MPLVQNLLKWLQFIQDSFVLDISRLERRWLKYKIKKLFPYALLIATILIFGFTLPFILSTKSSLIPQIALKKDPAKVIVITENNEGAMILEPSMHFIESMDVSSDPATRIAINIPSLTVPVQPPKTPISSLPALTPAVVQKQAVKAPLPTVKGNLTTIKRDDAAFDIHEIENRFKDNSNPNLGVYIARYHYDHGNYIEAYNYALKTNSINNSIDDNWLIFAKSLVKLGKEETAKKTLQLYISNSNSKAAKNYLDTLDKESLK